jgi:HD-GYP domain-containing protein (c-di-GMP phosphodiesterase class II)
LDHLIVQIVAALNMRTFYPENHPRVMEAIRQVIASLMAVLESLESDSLTFIIVGEDLLAEGQLLRKASLSQRQFVQILKQRGIERLTLAEGLDAEECHALVAALASGQTPDSTPHVVLGHVVLALQREDNEATTEKTRESLLLHIDPLREIFRNFRTDRRLPLDAMEQLVWSLIDSMSENTRAMLPLARLKEHDEYTFIHCVNVSMLVLAQARSFGIGGTMLHSFGLAGLLHDIGKLMVPVKVLNQPGKLEGEDWAVMQSHTEQGAWYLSEMEGASPLSIVVAYEHHFRADGKANYPVPRSPRLPNLATRMTSIADAFDAMSTVRPYQKPYMRAAALETIQKRAETFYDPILVANFVRMVSEGVGEA